MSIFAAVQISAAAPAIDATIEPSQITLGDSARLTIMTSGTGTLSVTLPEVSGLEFRVVGQSRQIQIINGATVSSTSTIVRVTPEVAGIFTIPGLAPHSPPLVLRVNPANGSGSSGASNGADPTAKVPILPGGSGANGIRLTPDGSAFIRLELPKRDVYVGESIPVEIQVGMRQGFAGINGLPTLNSSDFTFNNLSHQPEQTTKAIDGKAFTVVTWHSLLAAVKPGTYSLTVEAPFRVRIRTQSPRDSLLDDLLGDPFMQNFFGASVMKDIVVTSPQAGFTVLPLPTEGRPPDFSGAVGSFKIASDVSAPTTTAGDPLTLRMHVTGTGNFDRVDSPMLSGDGQWKTYLPKSTFKSAEPTGYRGEKIFEQPLIASHPGAQTIPSLSFSYFDPTLKRYQTARSAPLNVTVSPSLADTAPSTPPNTPSSTASNRPAPPPTDSHGLRPDHVSSDAVVSTLVPLYLQPRFLALPSALVLIFAGGWFAARRRERGADAVRLKNERAQWNALLNQMQSASASGDAAVFFNSARTALQQTLSTRWHLPPQDITLAEVDARLDATATASASASASGTATATGNGNGNGNGNQNSNGDSSDIRQIFALADEANYSGHELKATDFERWTQAVRRQMQANAS